MKGYRSCKRLSVTRSYIYIYIYIIIINKYVYEDNEEFFWLCTGLEISIPLSITRMSIGEIFRKV